MEAIEVKESVQISAADVLHWLNAIEADRDKVINSLHVRTDDELLEIRAAARGMGNASWRIECACDAEITKRIHARVGRGHKDEKGEGVHAAVLRQAFMLGLSPSTVYQNARLHKTFFEGDRAEITLSVCSNLDIEEKSYFIAAMADSDDASFSNLEKIAQAKIDKPQLSVREAFRIIKQTKAPDIDAPAGHTLSDNEHIQAKWEQFQKAAQELVGVAPHLTGAMRVALEEIGYEISRPSETNRELIFNALSEGVDEIDEIAKHIHKHRDFVTRWMNSLADEGLVRSFQKERAPTSRGAKRTGWEIV